MSKGIRRVFRRNKIIFSMLAMVFDCILLVPNSQRILKIHVVKKMPDILFPIYIWYRTVTLQQVFSNLYQWFLCIDICCLQDTGICTSASLLYNDGYRKHCLDHAGMYCVLCEVQMIYNTRFTILYRCIYIWTFYTVMDFTDTISFIVYCLSIYYYHFMVLNALSPFTIFYHVPLHEVCCLYDHIVLCIEYYTCFVRNDEIKMSNQYNHLIVSKQLRKSEICARRSPW